MIFENIHYLLQFDDRGNLLALVSKSSGRNYIVKDGYRNNKKPCYAGNTGPDR